MNFGQPSTPYEVRCPMDLGQPTNSSEARRLMNLGQPKNLSVARGVMDSYQDPHKLNTNQNNSFDVLLSRNFHGFKIVQNFE